MHGIIHHMHSGSGDAPDEHGGETHRLFRSLFHLRCCGLRRLL